MTETPQRARILAVDDDPPLLDAIKRAFSEAGHDVTAHSTFEGARSALRSETFDAVVTDVRLGAFNGLQLAVIARNTHPNIRIIVFSGFDDPVLRHDAESIGATYLVKPVSFEKLREILEQREPDDGSKPSL